MILLPELLLRIPLEIGILRDGQIRLTVSPDQALQKLVPEPLPAQAQAYPPTRFMGSKSKLLAHIWAAASRFEFETVVDLFSGSGIVGYMFKANEIPALCVLLQYIQIIPADNLCFFQSLRGSVKSGIFPATAAPARARM